MEKAYEAVPIYWEAANKGYVKAYYYLGLIDPPGRLGYNRTAASQHDTTAILWLADYYGNKYFANGMAKMYMDSIKYYETAAYEEGLAQGYNYMFESLYGDSSILVVRYIMAKTSALMGNADGMAHLAFCYKEGIGVDVNKAAALVWYQAALAHGCEKYEIENSIRVLNGQKPVYGAFDYRTLEANQKILNEHPDRRPTKADLPGGYVSPAEIQYFNNWRAKNAPAYTPAPSAKNYAYYTTPTSQSNHDQQYNEQMRQQAAQRDNYYKAKWGN